MANEDGRRLSDRVERGHVAARMPQVGYCAARCAGDDLQLRKLFVVRVLIYTAYLNGASAPFHSESL